MYSRRPRIFRGRTLWRPLSWAGVILGLMVAAVAGSLPSQPASSTGLVCPPSISFGETIKCSIDAPAEIDTYTFTGELEDQVVVRMNRTPGTLDPHIRVYGPDGTLLCGSSKSSFDRLAEVQCALEASGVHTILAGDLGAQDTGEYAVHLQRTNGPGSANAIAFGETIKGTLTNVADLGAYKIFHTETLGTLPQVNSITTYVVMESRKDERA